MNTLLIILALITSFEEKTKVTAKDIHEFVNYSYQGEKTLKAVYARNTHFYYANCDDIKDIGWGCAWRAFQTCCSSYGVQFSIHDLYKRYYNDFEDVEKGKPGQWAEPGFAKKIFHAGSYKLYLFNRKVGSEKTPTEECRWLPTFQLFTHTLFAHFESKHTPVMFDDGNAAMNILGVKTTDAEQVILWIADPHKISKSAGLYYVVLDANGKRLHCTGIDNGKNGMNTAQMANPVYGWMILMP